MKISINKRLVSFALNGINKLITAADAAESFGAIALGNVVNTTTTFVIFSGVPAAITARNAKNREVQNTSLHLNDALFHQQAA